MLAASFSHNDLTEIGRPHSGMGGEHSLERQLSGHYDFPHGEGLAVIMPAYLKYMVAHGTEKEVARVADFGARVFDADAGAGGDAGAEANAGAGAGASGEAGAGTGASEGADTEASTGADTGASEARAIAYKGIELFIAWLRSLGLPTTLTELGVPTEELDEVAERCIENTGGQIKGYMTLDAPAIREIFTLAR
jgi:alcohol dehydrogenase YqhD (iron-dependent ADH family)